MDNFFKIWRKEIIVCLFLVASSLFVYLQVINYDFIYFDDELYVIDNPNVKAGLNRESIIWSFTSGTMVSNYWHPLTWLSHILDFQLYGMNAGGHHMTSLLFHIANTLLLFFIFRRMTGAIWRSAFVAGLFALHPLHVESVAWVAERKDVLSTFFWLLTMLAYYRYVEKPVLIRYFMVLLFFVMGLMSKPMLVTLPFVLLLIDYWPLGRLQLGQSIKTGNVKTQKTSALHLVWEKTPFFLLTAVASVAAYITQQKGGALTCMDLALLKIQIANALVSYVSYIGKMIWPGQLAVFYPHPGTLPIWESVGAGLLLISITAFIVSAWRRFPYLFVGWFWYIGTLVPVIGLVKVGSFAMADRYTYVPLIGLFIIIAWGLRDISAKWQSQRILLPIFSGIALVFFMICTWFQAGHWQNGITIFKHALDVTKNNRVANCELGHALMRNGMLDDAVVQLYKALKNNPNYEDAHANLGCTLARQNKVNDAICHYQKALRINQNNIKVHNNLGVLLAGKGKVNDSIYHYQEALRINPKYAGAYYNLGKIYANKGDVENTILYYKKTLQVGPNMAEALYNLS